MRTIKRRNDLFSLSLSLCASSLSARFAVNEVHKGKNRATSGGRGRGLCSSYLLDLRLLDLLQGHPDPLRLQFGRLLLLVETQQAGGG